MLHNNFKIAFRRLRRDKLFTLIDILGLSIGISAFYLITHYVSFELSYDQFHVNEKTAYGHPSLLHAIHKGSPFKSDKPSKK